MRDRSIFSMALIALAALVVGYMIGLARAATTTVTRVVTVPAYRTRTIYRVRTVIKIAPVATAIPTTPQPPATAMSLSSETPTSVPSPSGVHICLFTHFDQTHARCLQDDRSIDLGAMPHSQVVWAASMGHDSQGNIITADIINILQQDGTGAWVVAGSFIIKHSNMGPDEAANPYKSETQGLEDVLIESNVLNSTCNSSYKVQIVSGNGNVFGAAPITFTC